MKFNRTIQEGHADAAQSAASLPLAFWCYRHKREARWSGATGASTENVLQGND